MKTLLTFLFTVFLSSQVFAYTYDSIGNPGVLEFSPNQSNIIRDINKDHKKATYHGVITIYVKHKLEISIYKDEEAIDFRSVNLFFDDIENKLPEKWTKIPEGPIYISTNLSFAPTLTTNKYKLTDDIRYLLERAEKEN